MSLDQVGLELAFLVPFYNQGSRLEERELSVLSVYTSITLLSPLFQLPFRKQTLLQTILRVRNFISILTVVLRALPCQFYCRTSSILGFLSG